MNQVFILSEPVGVVKKPSDLFSKIKRFDIDYPQKDIVVFFMETADNATPYKS